MNRCWLTVLALVIAFPAWAEVTRVEVRSRADLAFAGYEKITGRVFFAVDPGNPRNAVIVDLDKAPANAAGRVEFSADFTIVRPKSGGNGVAIVDIVNRGNRTIVSSLNRARGTDPDVGDGFLMRRGFTVAAVGWEFDLSAQGNLIRLAVPAATDGSKPITGIVRARFTPDGREASYRFGDLAGYTPSDPAGPESVLTVRDGLDGPIETIARDRWQLAGITVTLAGGFEPGRIYELAFRAANPPVGGLGLAAVRDFATWIKHDPTALASASHVYAFGSSQSGRFLRTFLYQGFNADERGRQVFDAVMAHIAGAARLDLNRRWSTPTSASAMATEYPFANQALRDPVSGLKEGLVDNPRASGHQPKIFYTNTSVEYWNSSGRVAALIHTTPDGTRDVELPDNTRSYFFAGTQHGPAAFPPTQGAGRERSNPTDYWWSMRALVIDMDEWVRRGVTPPASQLPRLESRTLVRAQDVAFPAIPDVVSPRTLTGAARVSNTLVAGGAGVGAPLPLLVPELDADGNERAGIRLPDVAIPLATYTGWNFRRPDTGGTSQTVSLLGSYIPFARTKADRERQRDPRQSIEERYPAREHYLAAVKAAADRLVRDRFLLADDVDAIVGRAAAHWDLVVSPRSEPNGAR